MGNDSSKWSRVTTANIKTVFFLQHDLLNAGSYARQWRVSSLLAKDTYLAFFTKQHEG